MRVGLFLLLLFCVHSAYAVQVLVLVDNVHTDEAAYVQHWWKKAQHGINIAASDMQATALWYVNGKIQQNQLLYESEDIYDYLPNIDAAIIAVKETSQYENILADINNLRIPVISFHYTNLRNHMFVNPIMDMSQTSKELGFSIGKRAKILEKNNVYCFFSENKNNRKNILQTLCQSLAEGANISAKNVITKKVSSDIDTAISSIANTIIDDKSILLFSVDEISATAVTSALEKENFSDKVHHISMWNDKKAFAWIENRQLECIVTPLPWLEGYVAFTSAFMAVHRQQNDPVAIIVGIREHPFILQKLSQLGFSLQYQNRRIRNMIGIVDINNIDVIRPLFEKFW